MLEKKKTNRTQFTGFLKKAEMKVRRVLADMARHFFSKLGVDKIFKSDPRLFFHSDYYLCHNARRLEHLASLRIPVAGLSVLEVGAGIGDHSHYFIDRGCTITITDARPENVSYLRKRYPRCKVCILDLENPVKIEGAPFDIVYCYGLLYHLRNPEESLRFLARNTKKMLLLETCVSFGDREEINLEDERQWKPTQAYSGTGCRPTRVWLFKRLQRYFEHIYVPVTQPNHEEFPLDWTAPERHSTKLSRAIFIGSRVEIENDLLKPSLINKHIRHE